MISSEEKQNYIIITIKTTLVRGFDILNKFNKDIKILQNIKNCVIILLSHKLNILELGVFFYGLLYPFWGIPKFMDLAKAQAPLI